MLQHGRSTKRTIDQVSDEDFIRALIEPTILDLDAEPDRHSQAADVDDDAFTRALTDPVMLNM